MNDLFHNLKTGVDRYVVLEIRCGPHSHEQRENETSKEPILTPGPQRHYARHSSSKQLSLEFEDRPTAAAV